MQERESSISEDQDEAYAKEYKETYDEVMALLKDGIEEIQSKSNEGDEWVLWVMNEETGKLYCIHWGGDGQPLPRKP